MSPLNFTIKPFALSKALSDMIYLVKYCHDIPVTKLAL